MATQQTFHGLLREAVRYFAVHGYEDAQALAEWVMRLRGAAEREAGSSALSEQAIRKALGAYYERAVSLARLRKHHPGVSRFTVDLVRPEMRRELDRRILASVDLIRINRDRAIEQTLQRFSGWVSSVPVGGSKVVDKLETVAHIAKPVAQVKYEARRLSIDQGHKLLAAIDAVIGEQSGAIAMEWHSHWRQAGYDYREDHKERDGKIYAIRDSWAVKAGLINKGAGWSDAMTQPAEEVFCRCNAYYINMLDDLPDSMLTEKGRRYMRKA